MKSTTAILEDLIQFGKKSELKVTEISLDIYEDCEIFRVKFRREI